MWNNKINKWNRNGMNQTRLVQLHATCMSVHACTSFARFLCVSYTDEFSLLLLSSFFFRSFLVVFLFSHIYGHKHYKLRIACTRNSVPIAMSKMCMIRTFVIEYTKKRCIQCKTAIAGTLCARQCVPYERMTLEQNWRSLWAAYSSIIIIFRTFDYIICYCSL